MLSFVKDRVLWCRKTLEGTLFFDLQGEMYTVSHCIQDNLDRPSGLSGNQIRDTRVRKVDNYAAKGRLGDA